MFPRVFSQAKRDDEPIQHGCHGHEVHQRRVHLRETVNGPDSYKHQWGWNTHHDACASATAEVQLAVDITQIIAYWSDGAVERDDIAVVILQLR